MAPEAVHAALRVHTGLRLFDCGSRKAGLLTHRQHPVPRRHQDSGWYGLCSAALLAYKLKRGVAAERQRRAQVRMREACQDDGCSTVPQSNQICKPGCGTSREVQSRWPACYATGE